MDDLLCPKIFSNELLKYFTFSAFWLRKLCRTQQASTVQMVFSKFWQMGDLRTRNLNKILGKYEFCTIESQLLIRFSFIVILTKITKINDHNTHDKTFQNQANSICALDNLAY